MPPLLPPLQPPPLRLRLRLRLQKQLLMPMLWQKRLHLMLLSQQFLRTPRW
jgi:hypothetical protein